MPLNDGISFEKITPEGIIIQYNQWRDIFLIYRRLGRGVTLCLLEKGDLSLGSYTFGVSLKYKEGDEYVVEMEDEDDELPEFVTSFEKFHDRYKMKVRPDIKLDFNDAPEVIKHYFKRLSV